MTKNIHTSQKNIFKDRNVKNTYIYNIIIVIIIFILLILVIISTYKKDAGINSHYKGDCLIDLATSYHTHNCLDN